MNIPEKSHNEPPGIGLRIMSLTTPPSDLGFKADKGFPTIYGVLTDWNIGLVSATVMAMRDGTASLYTTSTFGIIGGQGHERVRQAAIRNVKAAEQFAASANLVTDYPYPENGQVVYYLLTYEGVRQIAARETAIQSGSDPTRPLFEAAQNVLTELRLIVDKS